MKKVILLLLFCVTLSFFSAAQNTYQKKVVSYVNTVVATPQNDLTAQHKDYIVRQLENSVRMERFTYAELPKAIVENFSRETDAITNVAAEIIRPVVEKTLSAELLRILDANKELLSKQNLTEEEKNTFLATKAQAAGLSASQLEKILNSGFFYVPYIERYNRTTRRDEREIKNKEGKVVRKQKFTVYTHEIELGLLWYQMKVDRSNNPTIVFIGAAKGWENSAIERSESQDDGENSNADWKAFTEAVDVSAININNETKKIEEFKLTSSVAEVTMFGIKMNLGTREGVGLDDSYWVEEEVESESGEIKKEQRGFVKIRDVGDNKRDESALSYAQTITGLGYSPGLLVKEIPLLGVNGVLGFGQMPIQLSTFNKTFMGLSKNDFAININSEIKNTFGVTGSVQFDMAKGTKISELWFHGGGALGTLNVDGKFYLPVYNSSGTLTGFDSTNDIGFSLTGNLNVGILKKIYFRRFGFLLGADVKVSFTSFSATGKDKNNDDLTYSLINRSWGVVGKGGLEIYITPTLSFGGAVSYTASSKGNQWDVSVEDKDKNETKKDDVTGPEVNYSGLGWLFWINYALPSLH